MRRTNFLLFFVLPFGGLVAIFFLFSSLNRNSIQQKTQDLIREQLEATSDILKVNVTHFLDENTSPEKVITLSAGGESIYYLALLDSHKNILSWSSRYEGYLPLSAQDTVRSEPWIISSPAGRILNVLEPISTESRGTYYLYLGYSLQSLEGLISRSRHVSFLFFGLLVAVGIIFFIGVFMIQKNYLAKTREAEGEKEQKERFREISALTSAVAHEIKNPLNSLSLLIELIQKKAPAEMKEDAALGKSEVHKISEIVDRFAYSLQPLRLNKERFALRELITAVRESIPYNSLRPGVEFRYGENGPISLWADKNLLGQCLLNLLQNAFEATETGTVEVEAAHHRKRAIIRITDTGRGIAADQLPQVFAPFFTTKDKGMGIGLYLAKKIIEAHGGQVEAWSEAGSGTTMTIRLPGGIHE